MKQITGDNAGRLGGGGLPMERVLGRAGAAVAGVVVGPVYRAGLAARSRRFDRGVGVRRLALPVVSVGNLTLGGTGKTPMVRRVVGWLTEAGERPCVAMRGYAVRGSGGKSDEAAEYAAALPGVAVVAGADRFARVSEFLAGLRDEERPTCVVLDDGFQHRALARDLDIVLVDVSRDPLRDRLFPRGWLREPASALGRAGVVIATHAESVPPAEVEKVRHAVVDVSPRAVFAVAGHAWHGVEVIEGGGSGEEGVGWLAGKRVLVVCAIGNPGALLGASRRAAEAEGGGGGLAEPIVLRDHDPYSERTVRRIMERAKGADCVLTTRKDWVKLEGRGIPWPCAVVVPRLEVEFWEGEERIRDAVMGVVGGG